MKLNPDCVRDILLSVESICTCNRIMNYNSDSEDNPKLLRKYPCDEIVYHIQQCDKHGFLVDVNIRIEDEVYYISIKDLSPRGHAFIANIREDDIWNETKSIVEKVGSLSLPILAQIAENAIAERIESQTNLNYQ